MIGSGAAHSIELNKKLFSHLLIFPVSLLPRWSAKSGRCSILPANPKKEIRQPREAPSATETRRRKKPRDCRLSRPRDLPRFYARLSVFLFYWRRQLLECPLLDPLSGCVYMHVYVLPCPECRIRHILPFAILRVCLLARRLSDDHLRHHPVQYRCVAPRIPVDILLHCADLDLLLSLSGYLSICTLARTGHRS